MSNALAFSTLGCPDWSLEQILDAAQKFTYDAIELRGLQDQMDLPLAPPFMPAQRAKSRRRIADAGIFVSCVASSGVVELANFDHVKSHAELACDLGAPYVRVFGGRLAPELAHAEAIARAAEVLRHFGDIAGNAGVAIVLETHDSFSRGAQVAELLEATRHPAVFALWDMHHPYRQGETPEETAAYLQDTTRYVHVKDSLNGNYTLMGNGDVPLTQMLDLALGNGYQDVISVEWEKRWIPSLPEPEIALPQYAQALRAYFAARAR